MVSATPDQRRRAGAALDPWLPRRVVLRGERDKVPFAQAVMDAGQRNLVVSEFASLCS